MHILTHTHSNFAWVRPLTHPDEYMGGFGIWTQDPVTFFWLSSIVFLMPVKDLIFHTVEMIRRHV